MQDVLALSLTQRLGLPAWARDAGLVAAGSLLVAALSHGTSLSVGCYCAEEARCHRSVLRALLLEHGASLA